MQPIAPIKEFQSGYRNGHLYIALARSIIEGHGQWAARSTYAVWFGRGSNPSYITLREWSAARALAAATGFRILAGETKAKMNDTGHEFASLEDAADFLRAEVGAAWAVIVPAYRGAIVVSDYP